MEFEYPNIEGYLHRLWIRTLLSTFWTLRWRHNGSDGVWNHQHHHCLLNRVFRRRTKKTSKLRVTGLCAGNSPGTGEFPAQMASNAENGSIWWRHHGLNTPKSPKLKRQYAILAWFLPVELTNTHPYSQVIITILGISTPLHYRGKCCLISI